MGGIEAHRKRRQVETVGRSPSNASKGFVYTCLSMDMEANYSKADCVH